MHSIVRLARTAIPAVTAAISSLGFLPQCLAAEEAPDRCQRAYAFPEAWALGEGEKQELTTQFQALCRKIESGELTKQAASATWFRSLFRSQWCLRNEARPSHVAYLQANKAPQAVVNVWTKFCRDT